MRGKYEGDTIYVMDAYPLPVEGTETRVNAGDEALEYVGKLEDLNEEINKQENCVGWFHSHPNYGPWLSKIDIETQKIMQYNDPMIAIVIDPIRSFLSGTVDIGAFRTCDPDQNPQQNEIQDGSLIPKEKVKDFGKHFMEYYSLEVELFMNQSDYDLIEEIWTSFWKNQLTNSQLSKNISHTRCQIERISNCSHTLTSDLMKALQRFKKNNEEKQNGIVKKNQEAEQCQKRLESYAKIANEMNLLMYQECVQNLAFNV